jgi:hypothetical protein
MSSCLFSQRRYSVVVQQTDDVAGLADRGLGGQVRPGGDEATSAAQADGEDARDSVHGQARRVVDCPGDQYRTRREGAHRRKKQREVLDRDHVDRQQQRKANHDRRA